MIGKRHNVHSLVNICPKVSVASNHDSYRTVPDLSARMFERWEGKGKGFLQGEAGPCGFKRGCRFHKLGHDL